MLQVGSVVPGGCAVAILWRLYGDEDGPLRTSPNLSLRYSHGRRGTAAVPAVVWAGQVRQEITLGLLDRNTSSGSIAASAAHWQCGLRSGIWTQACQPGADGCRVPGRSPCGHLGGQ